MPQAATKRGSVKVDASSCDQAWQRQGRCLKLRPSEAGCCLQAAPKRDCHPKSQSSKAVLPRYASACVDQARCNLQTACIQVHTKVCSKGRVPKASRGLIGPTATIQPTSLSCFTFKSKILEGQCISLRLEEQTSARALAAPQSPKVPASTPCRTWFPKSR